MSEDWRVPAEDEDPLLRSARREMKVAVIFWAVFATWAIGLGKLLAYQKPVDGALVNTILGMPSWVFWVVMLPWFVATVFTLWFALCFMKDHDLLADSEISEESAGTSNRSEARQPETLPVGNIEQGVTKDKDEVRKKGGSAGEGRDE